MHRLATVHARDNQTMTNDVTTQPISISASFTEALKNWFKQYDVKLVGCLSSRGLWALSQGAHGKIWRHVWVILKTKTS